MADLIQPQGEAGRPQPIASWPSQPYFARAGLRRVVVACPAQAEIGGAEALNVVCGINHQLDAPDRHRLITAACCTTLQDVTNIQQVVDGFRSDNPSP